MGKYWKCENCENINSIGFFSPTRKKQKCQKCEKPRISDVKQTTEDRMETLLRAVGTNQVAIAELAQEFMKLREKVLTQEEQEQEQEPEETTEEEPEEEPKKKKAKK